MRIRALSIFLIVLGISAGLSGRVCAQRIWLSDLPAIEGGQYKADAYIKAAEQLQRMDRHAAIQQLYGLAHDADSFDLRSYPENAEKTVILCRMLFTKKPGFKLERPALLGTAAFYGEHFSFKTTSYTNWPSEPIELVDGIPFAIVSGYAFNGVRNPHGTESYVQYYLTNGVWSDYHFTLKSEAEEREALKKLITSSKWREPLKKWEQRQLTAQIQ